MRTLIGNIKGPQGNQGPQGAQGPQGTPGARGAQGPVGPMPPLVNNGTATIVGTSALDAVQGNPNVAGTLAAQVSKLNEEMEYRPGYIRDFNSPGGPYFGFGLHWNPAIYINPNKNKLYLRYIDEQGKSQTIEYSLTRI